MQKRFSVLLALTLISLFIFPVRAQDALTQTFTTADGSYSFMYPEGWTATSESGGYDVAFSAPDKSVEGNIRFADDGRPAKEEAVLYTTGTNVTEKNVSIKELQINGLPAYTAQFKAGDYTEEIITVDYPNSKVFNLAVYEETPDAIANTGATLVAMASSFKVDVPVTPAPDTTAAQASGIQLTETMSASDGSYSFMYPKGWQWTSTPPNGFILSGIDGDSALQGTIALAPKDSGMSAETAVQAFGSTVKTAQINGQKIIYAEVPATGLAVVVTLPNQAIFGLFQGDDAVIQKQEANVLAIMASIKSSTGGSSTSAEATPAESATEATSAPAVKADVGEGAILAIVDGQVGGSTGMGNELYELNIDTKTGKSLQQFGTTSSAEFNNVAWSPDGSQLAIYSIQPPGVLITDVNGGNPTVIQRSSSVFAWAPDGKHITNAEPSANDYEVTSIGFDGKDESTPMLLKAMQYIDFLRWSPDGKWLAYVGTPADNNDNQDALHIIDATGNNDQVIVPASEGDLAHDVMWSADGTQLAYIKSDNLTTTTLPPKPPKWLLNRFWRLSGHRMASSSSITPATRSCSSPTRMAQIPRRLNYRLILRGRSFRLHGDREPAALQPQQTQVHPRLRQTRQALL